MTAIFWDERIKEQELGDIRELYWKVDITYFSNRIINQKVEEDKNIYYVKQDNTLVSEVKIIIPGLPGCFNEIEIQAEIKWMLDNEETIKEDSRILSEKLSKYLINILKYVVEEKWMLSIDTADYIKEIEKKVNWLDFSK